MANEIGTAYLSIVANTTGMDANIRKGLKSSFNGASVASGKSGSKAGSSFATGVIKTVAKAAAVVKVGATVGKAISLGMTRAISIENAQKKLEGLGHSSKSITSIMDSALKSVKGTAYGLGDAASVAAMMAAAGVKNGKEMTSTLSTVADVAAISGRSLTDIGTIFGSVAARGKLQGDDMLQLMSSGVPVLQLLAKQTGKTSAEVSDMVSKGQIDFATFRAAMDAGMGGAAQAAGETFTGAMMNANAALGRLGEAFMSPAIEAAKPLLAGFTGLVDTLTSRVKPLASAWAGQLVPAAEKFGESLSALAGGASLTDVFPQVGTLLKLLSVLSPLGLAIKAIIPLMPQVATAAGQILTAFGPVVPVLASVAGELAGALATALMAVVPALLPLVVSVAQLTAELLANKPVVYALLAGFAGFQVVAGVAKAVTFAKTALTGAKVAMVALNVAMRANPIGIVVTLVAALVAGLVSFFTQTETGRAAWASFMSWMGSAWAALSAGAQAAWTAISGGVQAAAIWVQGAWTSTITAITGAWAAVAGFFAGIWASITTAAQVAWTAFTTVIQTAMSLILPVISAPLQVIGTLFRTAWDTIKTVVAAAFLVIVSLVTGNFGQISGIVSAAWVKIKSIFTSAGAAIGSAVSGAWNAIKSIFSSAGSAIASLAVAAWSRVKSAFSAGVSGAVGFARGLPGKAAAALSSLGGAITALASAAWSKLKSAFSAGVAAAVALVRELPGKAAAALGSVGSTLLSAGSDLVSGFIRGIQNGVARVADAARNLAQAAWKAATAALEIHSPSRVFRNKVGRQIPAGLALGIGDGKAEVVSAITKLSDLLVKTQGDAIKKESKRLQEVRRKENKKIAAWNQDRGKGVKARKSLGALSAVDAEKQAKANLAAATADTKAVRKQIAAQKRLTATLWDDGKYKGGIARWQGLNKGTVRLLQGLTKAGNVRKNAAKAVQGATLADIGKAQDQITAAITSAKATLKEMRDASTQLAASVSSSLQGELDLGSAVGEDGKTSKSAVMSLVSGLAAKVKKFAGLLSALAKKGLPSGLIQEVASLGTTKGIPVANALKSMSAKETKTLSSDYGSLVSWSATAGKTVADSMYKVGVDAQKGLVDGLLKDSDKLEKAAKVLTDKVVKAAKRSLGIKSPSRVLRDQVGRFVPAGLADGIAAGTSDVEASARRMAAAAVPSIPDVTAGGVSASATAAGTAGAVDQHITLNVPAAAFADVETLLRFVRTLAARAHVTVGG